MNERWRWELKAGQPGVRRSLPRPVCFPFLSLCRARSLPFFFATGHSVHGPPSTNVGRLFPLPAQLRSEELRTEDWRP